ncbi:MAG TPA: CoA-binding protein [Ignavibacteria bacterium]|nr:CoA-binding protein [Ignavibacteria bacterium]
MTIKEILNNYNTIAVVGYSDNPQRDSHEIALQMKQYGYNIIGVNPALAGKTIDGIKCYGTLSDIEEEIDIVDIFRRSEFVPEIVAEANKMKNKPVIIWAQLGVISSEGAELAKKYAIKNL